MPLPADGVAAIQRFADSLNAEMPPHVAGRMRYETRIDRNAVTLVEVAPTDFGDPLSAEFGVMVARLRFTRSRGWELYWPDRDSAFHVYEALGPTDDVTILLAEIREDPTAIFFG